MILAALFVALFAVASANTYTTTITTTATATTRGIMEEESSPILINGGCKQIHEQQIQHCMMFLSPAISPEEKMNALDEHLPECCQQLKQVKTKCRCMVIKELLWQLQHQQPRPGQSWQSQELEQMEQDAQDLPRRCYVEVTQPCIIGSAAYSSSPRVHASN